MADIALQPMHGEVQATEAAGFVSLLDAVDAYFTRRVARVFTPSLTLPLQGGGISLLLVFSYEAGAGYEHAARTARGVEDTSVIGFNHLSQQADDAGWGVEFAAFLALGAGKFAEKIFIDAPEGVVVYGCGNLGNFFLTAPLRGCW
jgi:hypothetical protein